MRSTVHSLVLVLVLLGLAGCSKNPGTWSKSEVEARLKVTLKLKEVSLTENPEGGYKGTGTAEDGTKYELTVTHDEKEGKLSYKAKSKKGEEHGAFIQSGR